MTFMGPQFGLKRARRGDAKKGRFCVSFSAELSKIDFDLDLQKLGPMECCTKTQIFSGKIEN